MTPLGPGTDRPSPISATSDENTETEERDGDRDLLTITREHPDASWKLIHTRRAATTAPENAKTVTPAGETIVNGTETVAIAGAESLKKGLLDATETGTYSMVAGPDGNAEEETVIANGSVTVTLSARGRITRGPRRLRLGSERLLLI